jgi:hypothetical protein
MALLYAAVKATASQRDTNRGQAIHCENEMTMPNKCKVQIGGYQYIYRSRDSSVSIQTSSEAHPAYYTMHTRDSFPGGIMTGV